MNEPRVKLLQKNVNDLTVADSITLTIGSAVVTAGLMAVGVAGLVAYEKVETALLKRKHYKELVSKIDEDQ